MFPISKSKYIFEPFKHYKTKSKYPVFLNNFNKYVLYTISLGSV